MRESRWFIDFVCNCDKKSSSNCGENGCPFVEKFSDFEVLKFFKLLRVGDVYVKLVQGGKKDE